jgi:hypothetical protein
VGYSHFETAGERGIVAEVNGESGKWGTPFLLRGRKGIFARLMGVGWVRTDGYFVLLSFDSRFAGLIAFL